MTDLNTIRVIPSAERLMSGPFGVRSFFLLEIPLSFIQDLVLYV
jgi:hypothetical protein